jgi:hypothetical protein
MPSLKLTNLAAYKAYFQAIATGANSHKEIDGFKWGDKDVMKNDSRSDMPARVLWATPYDGARYIDRSSDNINKVKQARVAYMIVPDSEKFSDIDAAFDACEAVIEQILTKILMDKKGVDVDGVWTMLVTTVDSWKTGPVEAVFGSTKYIGWELELNFMDNTNLAYDASKWN